MRVRFWSNFFFFDKHRFFFWLKNNHKQVFMAMTHFIHEIWNQTCFFKKVCGKFQPCCFWSLNLMKIVPSRSFFFLKPNEIQCLFCLRMLTSWEFAPQKIPKNFTFNSFWEPQNSTEWSHSFAIVSHEPCCLAIKNVLDCELPTLR